MQPPEVNNKWKMAFRDKTTKEVMGFFCGLPLVVCINGRTVKAIEAKNLFVHPKLRGNNLAPLLINELTRRVRIYGGYKMGFYTAASTITKPVVTSRYYRRILNLPKLLEIGFKKLKNGSITRELIRYQLPPKHFNSMREIREDDLEEALQLLNDYSKKFKLYQIMSEQEFRHWFLDKPQFLKCFVVENTLSKKLIALSSFYLLSAQCKSVSERDCQVLSAFSFYNAISDFNEENFKHLIFDTMIEAKKVLFSNLIFGNL